MTRLERDKALVRKAWSTEVPADLVARWGDRAAKVQASLAKSMTVYMAAQRVAAQANMYWSHDHQDFVDGPTS